MFFKIIILPTLILSSWGIELKKQCQVLTGERISISDIIESESSIVNAIASEKIVYMTLYAKYRVIYYESVSSDAMYPDIDSLDVR